VETPGGVSLGAGPVVDSTRATLVMFPDRELLAEGPHYSRRAKLLAVARSARRAAGVAAPAGPPVGRLPEPGDPAGPATGLCAVPGAAGRGHR
jgi:hypothetical protein